MKFVTKLNKRDKPYVIADEPFALSGGVGERFLNHDNINVKTVEIYTEPQRQGDKVLNYTVEKKDGAEWKLWLKVFAQAEQVYVSYESTGDTVEADDVNELQQAAVNLEADLQSEASIAQAHRDSRTNPHGVTKAQVGLDQADNTADLNKPVSTAQGIAIDAARSEAAEQLALHAGRTDNPHSVTKVQVGLGNADDTSDLNKPVSTAQAAAIEGVRETLTTEIGTVREDLAVHESSRDNPHSVTKAQVGLGSADDTSDLNKPVSTAQAAAIEGVRENLATELGTVQKNLTTELGTVQQNLTTEIGTVRDTLTAHENNSGNPHSVTKTQVGLGSVEDVLQASKSEFDSHSGDAVRHISAAERTGWNDKYTRNEVDNKLSALETAIDWKESVDTFAAISAAYPNPEDGWTVNVKDTDYTYRYSGTEWIAISTNAIPKATQSVDGLMAKEDKTVLDGIPAALTGKVDKAAGKSLSSNDYTDAEKAKLAGIAANANNYTHPSYTARTSGLNKVTVDTTGHVSAVAAVTKADITGLGIPAQDTVYTHPSSHPASMITGLATVAVSGSYNDLSNKPSSMDIPDSLPPTGAAGGDLSGTYPNPSVKDNSHAHTIDNVTGLQTALNGKDSAFVRTDLTIGGEANKYYPVIISGNCKFQYIPSKIYIWRGYGEAAPDSWGQDAAHKGGLSIRLDVFNNGWGGNHTIYDYRIHQRYCNMFGGIKLSTSSSQICIWLRGGNAIYHVDSEVRQGITVFLTDTTIGADSAKLSCPVKSAPDNTSLDQYYRSEGLGVTWNQLRGV